LHVFVIEAQRYVNLQII